ncbi:hypothetical protein NCCP1664_18310 [Zafaria cholistanensis]|uniref:Uncharacterized protein n=1 Tax=Zafaria cholistanensis TaxID=1682741 RepID=A0A5A7NRF9_9MICC|nr:hypothetical protein NCCP1664_18310 [Zafaria cholistanensis]
MAHESTAATRKDAVEAKAGARVENLATSGTFSLDGGTFPAATHPIRVAIVGVGSRATPLVQGVGYYKKAGLDRGMGGPTLSASSCFMKSPRSSTVTASTVTVSTVTASTVRTALKRPTPSPAATANRRRPVPGRPPDTPCRPAPGGRRRTQPCSAQLPQRTSP